MRDVTYDMTHGLTGTLLAFSIPDTIFSLGEKWVFAVVVALTSSLASRIISEIWKKVHK